MTKIVNNKITKKIYTHKIGGNLTEFLYGVAQKIAKTVRNGDKFLGRKAGLVKSSDKKTDIMLLVFFDDVLMPNLYQFFFDRNSENILENHYKESSPNMNESYDPSYDESYDGIFEKFMYEFIGYNYDPKIFFKFFRWSRNSNKNNKLIDFMEIKLLKIAFMKKYLDKLFETSKLPGNAYDYRTKLSLLIGLTFNNVQNKKSPKEVFDSIKNKNIDLERDYRVLTYHINNYIGNIVTINDTNNLQYHTLKYENKKIVFDFFKNFGGPKKSSDGMKKTKKNNMKSKSRK